MPKYTLELGDKVDALLAEWATIKQTTKSDILRRALATYVYFAKNTVDPGLKVSITDESDRIVKDIELP